MRSYVNIIVISLKICLKLIAATHELSISDLVTIALALGVL